MDAKTFGFSTVKPFRVAVFRLCLLLGLFLFFASCFEPTQGCLDLAAVNFDASADKDCEEAGCACVYPKLQVTVDQRYDSLAYRRDSVYIGTNGQRFRIHDVAFYLSDFQLFKNAAPFSVSDTLGLRAFSAFGNDTLRRVFRNDFQLVRLETQTYAVGDFRESGIFSEVNIRFGLDSDANRVVPRLAPANHPLSIQADSLWEGKNRGFVFLKVVVGRDVASPQTDTLRFTAADVGDFFIAQTSQFLHDEGTDFRLRLRADYKKLLGNVDWTTGGPAAWKQQVAANLPQVFQVSQ
jgi:hypothetical protein